MKYIDNELKDGSAIRDVRQTYKSYDLIIPLTYLQLFVFSQIPIATLHAVNTLVQNSQPTIQRIREMAQKRYENRQIAIAEGERIPKRHRKRHRLYGQAKTTADSVEEKKIDVKTEVKVDSPNI